VIFYTNDLFEDPPEPVLLGTDERAIKCVHGLAKISRWTGMEVLNRTDFLVAAPIVAYNKFMNGVDRMDQYRSTLATQRKEPPLHMTMFTYLMDLAICQSYALLQKMASQLGHSVPSFFNFKRAICEQLVTPKFQSSRVRPGQPSMANNNINSPDEQTTASTSNSSNGIAGAPEEAMSCNQTIDQAVGVIDEAHMLVENLPRKMDPNQPQDIDCFLCPKMGKELKTIYSCMKCRKGFHVNCFTAFHYRCAMNTSRRDY
jgi:hypothetical protein